MRVVPESDINPLEPAPPLDVDLARPIDKDVGDRLIGKQWLERTKSEDLVQDILCDHLTLAGIERNDLSVEKQPYLTLHLAPIDHRITIKHCRVEFIDQDTMNPKNDLVYSLPIVTATSASSYSIL